MSYRPRVSESLLGAGGEVSLPRSSITTKALTATSGNILLMPFVATRSEAITKGRVRVGATIAATVTTIKLGVYQVDAAGKLWQAGVTANTTTMTGTANAAGTTTNLAATWNKIAGRLYCAAFIFVGTTAPTIWGGGLSLQSTVPTAPFDFLPYDGPMRVTGQTDLVTSIAKASLTFTDSTAGPYIEFLP